ncbi:MAG: endonuclease/exonuclease/phosphatase family protein [Bdellovibrionaceae bacterium]|nr:endonuclease/exonuclease/phosphatase family protein [Pseudobdellovibrionaceae bacterium]
MPTQIKLLAIVLIINLTGCSFFAKKPEVPAGPRVTIMSYNVENLFDTQHDAGTEDFTFLPLALKSDPTIKAGCEKNSSDYRKKECFETDWNEEILKKKLSRVADVIKQVGGGKGPDIQILVEVENKRVVEKLRDEYLKDSGYQTAVVIDSFDPRGIDPGVLSRFPMWREPKIHKIPLKALDKDGEWSAEKTRGILEVPVTLPDGTKALVFAVHFPSQSNPVYLRAQATAFINHLEKDLPPDVIAIVGGDFNITRDEDDKEGFFKTTLNEKWSVSHIEGCKSCEGTHYYHPKTEWSFLDALLVRRASVARTGWQIDPASIKIPNESKFQVSRYGSPARFDSGSPWGVSDHWPIYLEIYKPAALAAPTATPAAP